jgi:HAD superfamily hydrolase (TIGR01509 family)
MAHKISVLFDMDGVLVDSEPVIEAAAIMGLHEYGVPAKPGDFLPFVGMGEDKYIGGVAEKYGIKYELSMKKRVYDIYQEIVGERLKVYEGTGPLLEQLAAGGWEFALASSADSVKIHANLRVAGIQPSSFKVITSGEDVTRKKPYPDIYLITAEKMGYDPLDCIVVEDALSGIKAAKAAGMRCFAVTTSFPAEKLIDAGADYVGDDISELMEYIKGL